MDATETTRRGFVPAASSRDLPGPRQGLDELRAAPATRARLEALVPGAIEQLKAQGRSGQKNADNTRAVLDAIAEMPAADRILAERIHAIVTANAPELLPKTWNGMPAYATTDGKVVCFFKAAAKFEGRYAVLGFEDAATIGDPPIWPVVFAIVEWTPAVEKKVTALVKAAVS